MTTNDAIQQAVDRANAARKGKGARYLAVDVDNPGFLTLRFVKVGEEDGHVEGIYFQQESLLFRRLGRAKGEDGKIKVYYVHDKELGRMARAALLKPGDELRGPLIEAVHARRQKSIDSLLGKIPKKVKRKVPKKEKR